VTGLLGQEDSRSGESKRQYRPEQHQREAVDQRNSDVEKDVPQARPGAFGEVLVGKRHRNEQDQRCLDRRGEQASIADEHDGGDDADQVQACEGRRQLGPAGGVDDEAQKCSADGDGHCSPCRDTRHGCER